MFTQTKMMGLMGWGGGGDGFGGGQNGSYLKIKNKEIWGGSSGQIWYHYLP